MLISDLNDTLAVVLAIGDGRTLLPLTERRTTAAMPFAGNYRVIDFALTNCLHSGLRRIMVFTQFNSLSLHNHLRDGWSIFNTDLGEFITPVSPPVRERLSMYAGVTNALCQNQYLFDGIPDEHVIVVSGEQIYRMDYAAILAFHAHREADVTIAVVDTSDRVLNGEGGLLRLEGESVVGMAAAPVDTAADELHGTMGVYVFKRSALRELLAALGEDGGGGVPLHQAVMDQFGEQGAVKAYRFGGPYGRVSQDRYWRKLADLDAYYQANMDLLRLEPPLDIYQATWPIRTYQSQRPPARTVPGRSCNEGICVNSIVAGGTVIAGGGVSRSVLGSRVLINDNAVVEDAILFSDVKVGESARLERCIIDRNVEIPANEEIGVDRERDAARFLVTPGGVTVVSSDHQF